MTLQFQAYNLVAPFQNTSGLASQAAVLVDTNGVKINLSQYFGRLSPGHYFTLQADGAKVYVAVASNQQGSINPAEQGGGVGVCWPIPDGQSLPVRILGGREMANTGYSTMVNYASGVILHAKLAAGGSVTTGILRIYRSSLDETQGLGQFRPAGFVEG